VVHVAPAPVLARLGAAHDGVAAELEVFVRVGSRRGIAAGHVAALQAHPQMHRRRPLPFARLTEGTRRDGEIRGGLQVRTNAAGPGDSLAAAAVHPRARAETQIAGNEMRRWTVYHVDFTAGGNSPLLTEIGSVEADNLLAAVMKAQALWPEERSMIVRPAEDSQSVAARFGSKA